MRSLDSSFYESEKDRMSVVTMEQRRSGAGTTKLTDRDSVALTWISHQYAVRLDHLQVLLRQYKGAEISLGATRQLVNRWIHAGWVESGKFREGELSWVWPTEEGLSEVGLSYPYKDFDELYTLSDLRHLAAVNDIRLHQSSDWTSQRQLFQRQGFQEVEDSCEALYQPDAEILLSDGKSIAVKVQMRLLSWEDLTGSLIELLKRGSAQVWYFGGEYAIREEVRKMCALLIGTRDLSIEEADRLRVLWYPLALTDEDRQKERLEALLPAEDPANLRRSSDRVRRRSRRIPVN